MARRRRFIIHPHRPFSVAQKVLPRQSEYQHSGAVAWDNDQEGEGEILPINFFVENIDIILRDSCTLLNEL